MLANVALFQSKTPSHTSHMLQMLHQQTNESVILWYELWSHDLGSTYIVVEHSTIWGMVLRGEQVDGEEGCLSTRT